jgi:hypothetical protein
MLFRLLLGLLGLSGCIENDLVDPSARTYPDYDVPGLLPETHVDRIVQVVVPKADILWVIDNSCSMKDEQDELALNFPEFMSFFLNSGLDYHIGVVSTDFTLRSDFQTIPPLYIPGGKLQSTPYGTLWIDNYTPNPEASFADMATLGTNGSSVEMGLATSFYALEMYKDTVNYGFVRDDASLHTIVISDEQDYTPSTVISLDEYKSWYQNKKTDPIEETFSSIVTQVGFTTGWNYKEVTAEVGGIIWDITRDDWSTVLSLLGLQASSTRTEYFLSRVPVVSTIDVKVETPDGVTIDIMSDWSYEPSRNSIILTDYVPEPLETVVITYTIATGVH